MLHPRPQCPPKRQPPPIPKRNPSTRLSGPPLAPLSRSLDCDAAVRRSPYRQRQYSATLPRRSPKLDICAELLSYISELTQELMAETSFTEVSLTEESAEMGNAWPRAKRSSVAIQTEDVATRSLGRSVGTQVAKRVAEADGPGPKPVARPFRDIRKMLKEGSIEGIEDEPPVFKPPPPPTAYVTAQVNPVLRRSPKALEPKMDVGDYGTAAGYASSSGFKVRKCLSTFEPGVDSQRNDAASRPATAIKSPRVLISPPPISPQPCRRTAPDGGVDEPQEQRRRKPIRSSEFVSKAATIDRCFHERLSPAVSEKEVHHSISTPPPPPLNKKPPPKIVVEIPPKKKRQNSCGTSCSCLCLKRQSPSSSPVPLPADQHNLPSNQTRPAQYSLSTKNKSAKKQPSSPDAPESRQEAYDALIAEIRAAIKQRQTDDRKDESSL